MMIYANYTRPDGREVSALYNDWETMTRDTWNPETEIYSVIVFRVRGRTYRDRQADLCNTARRWQYESAPGLSWNEIVDVADWLYAQGKRYGLLRDFREEAII